MTAAWVVRDLRSDFRRHGAAWLVVAGCFAAAVSLLAAARLVGRQAPPSAAAAPRVQVIAYLRDELSPEEVAALTGALAALPGVEGVRRVGSGEALRRMRSALGRHARLLDGAEDGLLPDSLEVTVAPAGDPAGRAHQIGERLRRLPGISDLDELAPASDRGIGAEGIQADHWRRALQGLLGAGAAVALLAALILRPARRREEARVRVALGYTRLTAFLPALLGDLLAAAAGAGLAWAMIRGADRAWVGAALLVQLGARPAAVPLLSARDLVLICVLALVTAGLAGYHRVRVADPIDV
jgi:hypothetical protein